MIRNRSKTKFMLFTSIILILIVSLILPLPTCVSKHWLPSVHPSENWAPHFRLEYPMLAVANKAEWPIYNDQILWKINVNVTMTEIGAFEADSAMSGMAFAPDGTLYGITNVNSPSGGMTLYKINYTTGETTEIGSLGLSFVREGGLAITPDGVAYGVLNINGNNGEIFSINLTSGQATVVGILPDIIDLDGLAYRDDGKLLALHDITEYPYSRGEIVIIDPNQFDPENPQALDIEVLIELPDEIAPGGVGGITILDGIGYFATCIGVSGYQGTNELWEFDPYSNNPEDLVLADDELVELEWPVYSRGVSALTGIPNNLR